MAYSLERLVVACLSQKSTFFFKKQWQNKLQFSADSRQWIRETQAAYRMTHTEFSYVSSNLNNYTPNWDGCLYLTLGGQGYFEEMW